VSLKITQKNQTQVISNFDLPFGMYPGMNNMGSRINAQNVVAAANQVKWLEDSAPIQLKNQSINDQQSFNDFMHYANNAITPGMETY